MPRVQLTPTLAEAIAAGIRAGGYPHVAAQAWGVRRADFDGWLDKGASSGGKPRLLVAAVEQAHAQARLRAEMTVFRDDPRIWLEHGPGRDQPANPGWSSAPRPAPAPDAEAAAAATDWTNLAQRLLLKLLPFPEARLVVAEALHPLA